MSRWMRRSAARVGALALALLLPITAVIGPSQTAAAATGPDRPHDERVGDARVSGGIRNFSAEPNEKSLWISAEPFCSGAYRSCNAWVEFPGYSQKNVNPRGGYFVPWPSVWEPGTTRTVSIRYYAIDIVGTGWYGSPPLTLNVTRPQEFVPLTAAASNVNDELRSATVSGTATKGAQIRRNGQVVTNSDGRWSLNVSGLQVGTNELTFEQWVDGVYRDSKTVSVTIQAPLPGLTAIGTFPRDISQLATITGVAAKGAVVVIRAGGAEVARVQASGGDGSYLFYVPAPMAGGAKDFTVSQILAGVESGNVPVRLDYGAAVSITSPSDQSEQDVGATTISGRGAPGSTVTVTVNGQALPSTTVGPDGAWSTEGELVRGANLIEATQRSKGANTTTSSVTVDAGGTSVPTPTAEVVFGAAVTDNARVEGTAENGATVTIRDAAGAVIGSPEVVDGKYSLPVTSPGAGVHAFTVTQTIDGATSEPVTASGDFGAEVAVTALPAQVTPGERTVSGSGEDGRTVTVQVGSETKTTVVENGRWSVVFEFRPSNTSVPVSVTQIAQGNTVTTGSTSTTPNAAIAARPVTIEEPSSHEYTPLAVTTVSGTATPYATVKIETARGGLIREVQADKDGQWSFDRQYGPSNVYTLVATQTRFDGSTSRSEDFVMSPTGAFRALTLTSHADGGTYTPGQNTFTGTATPDALVRVTNQWGRQIASAQADPIDGAWAATGALGPTADYTLTFTQTAPNGQQDQLTIGLESDVPAWKDAALTSPTNNSTYRPGPVTFTGTGAEGTTIVANDQLGALIGTAEVGPDGTWAFVRDLGPTADYRITFTATRGPDSNTFTVDVNSPKFAALQLTSHQDGDTYTPGQPVTFAGKSSPFATIEVTTKRGGAIATTEADDEGEWSFRRAFGPSNTYEMVFTQTDVYGVVQDSVEFDYAPNPG